MILWGFTGDLFQILLTLNVWSINSETCRYRLPTHSTWHDKGAFIVCCNAATLNNLPQLNATHGTSSPLPYSTAETEIRPLQRSCSGLWTHLKSWNILSLKITLKIVYIENHSASVPRKVKWHRSANNRIGPILVRRQKIIEYMHGRRAKVHN